MNKMKWFNNLKTSNKLISAFLVLAIIMGFVGVFGIINLGKMNDSAHNMYTKVVLGTNQLQEAQVSYTRIRVNVRDLILASTTTELNDVKEDINNIKERVELLISSYRDSDISELEAKEIAPFESQWNTYKELIDAAIVLAEKNQNEALITLIKGDIKVQGDELRDIINNTVAAAVSNAKTTDDNNLGLYKSSLIITIIVIAAGVVLSIGFGILISRMISLPLNKAVLLVSKVANGDLREKIDINSKDEIGQLASSINQMVENLHNIIGNILLSAQSVSAASEQISASTQEIASGATNQASAAQTISELFNELFEAVNAVAQNTEEASELSSKTIEISKMGNNVIQNSMESMTIVSEQMKRLEGDSLKIGDIIQVIEDIADQTNLLALNAAIEAARAGEQGRGFAVVADEVRKLAERSGDATKQITAIIKGMQINTQQSVEAVQESVSLSKKTGESFKEITSIVEITGQKVIEIAAASEEQAAQASTVFESVESISAVTQESAASSEQTASTAQSLAQLADDLQQAVSIFKMK